MRQNINATRVATENEMSKGLCKVSLLGNLTADAEVRQVGSDSVCNFRVACNESYKTRDGEKRERTEYFTATMWGARGSALAPHLTKGTKIYVDGNLSTRTYEHNGQTRTSLEVKVGELVFAGGGKSDTQRSGGSSNDAGRDAYPEAQGGGYQGGQGSVGEDDLPFGPATGP